MIRKWNTLLLIALLTLLQCLAPLLHAHAGGLHSNEAGHVHLDALHVAPLQAHTEFRIDLSDTPSVSVPAEYRRDQATPGDEPAAIAAQVPYPVPAIGRAVWVAAFPLFQFCSPRLTPPAHAPPAIV